MEKEIRPRGLKKGETPQWKVGRKATGRKRDKTISFKVTDEEREMIHKILDNLNETRTGALLKILQEYHKKTE